MAQTGYKCFSNGIKAVPRDPMPTASPLQPAWGRSVGGVVVSPLASDVSCCLSPLCGPTAIPSGLCREHGWPGVRFLLPPDPVCPVPPVGNGGRHVLNIFWE